MMGRVLLIAGLMLWSAGIRAQDRTLALIARGHFTTGSELFPASDSPDPVERARSYPIDGILGGGLEVRYFPPGTSLAFGLSADYLRADSDVRISGIPASVPAEDGFRVIPVELTGYFLLPLSSTSFGVYMGGGLGAYFGRRIFRIADVEARPLDGGNGFGIHVLGGVQMQLSGALSLLAEMKFRDVQFQSTTAFPVASVSYRGIPVTLDRARMSSTVHVDGIVFQIGTAFTW
jgi:hypothetical protein